MGRAAHVRLPGRGPLDEGTARFIFQAAVGVGFFCIAASLLLGERGIQGGAAIFLVLSLLSLAPIFHYRRIYLGMRQDRWNRELERQQQALDQLFAQARAEQGIAPIREDADRA